MKIHDVVLWFSELIIVHQERIAPINFGMKTSNLLWRTEKQLSSLHVTCDCVGFATFFFFSMESSVDLGSFLRLQLKTAQTFYRTQNIKVPFSWETYER